MLSAGTSHIRQGIRYPSHTCRNRRHSLSPATSNGLHQRIEHHHVFEHIPHPSWFTGQPYVHEYLSPISSPLRHRPSGSSPLRYPVTSTSNSYSSFNHFFILQSYHTRCFFLHSSPSFASLRRWRLLEGKVEYFSKTVSVRL